MRKAATIKRELWKVFSEYIRRKDADHSGYVSCVSCGKTDHWREMDCGHYLRNSERNKQLGGNELWYDTRNFAPQCHYCNRFDGEQAGKVWGEKMGADIGGELRYRREQAKKWTKDELERKIIYLKGLTKDLNV
jgi:hypothetical protein